MWFAKIPIHIVGLIIAIITNVNGQNFATTTRYWDCSGGACACGYLTSNGPAHCYSNAMFAAPTDNIYGAKFYGAAAVSPPLYGTGTWLGPGCGKCYLLTGQSNIPGFDETTVTKLVLKATNLCPPSNSACANGNVHFDIAAAGFDFSGASQANTCDSVDSAELPGYRSCGFWMINSPNPNNGCDCSLFQNAVLRAGCTNFQSLLWNNPTVIFEEVTCPAELDRLYCGTSTSPWLPSLEGPPDTCANNAYPTSPTPVPPTPVPPTPVPPTPVPPTPVPPTPVPPTPVPPTPTPPTPVLPTPTPPTPVPPTPTPPTPAAPTPTPPTPVPPTPTPPTPPTGGGNSFFCCSNDYKNCLPSPWCNENPSNCNNCGNTLWIDISTRTNCLARWSECTNNANGCCDGVTCQGNVHYSQCL